MINLLVTENAGYEIIECVTKGDTAHVLAKKELDGWTKYATWVTSDGKSFYHGHYFHDLHNGQNVYEAAYEDMQRRAGYMKTETPEQMLRNKGKFGIVWWSDDDFREALENEDIEPTDKNIEILRGLVWENFLMDAMIAHGWEYIYNEIRQNLSEFGIEDDDDDEDDESYKPKCERCGSFDDDTEDGLWFCKSLRTLCQYAIKNCGFKNYEEE